MYHIDSSERYKTWGNFAYFGPIWNSKANGEYQACCVTPQSLSPTTTIQKSVIRSSSITKLTTRLVSTRNLTSIALTQHSISNPTPIKSASQHHIYLLPHQSGNYTRKHLTSEAPTPHPMPKNIRFLTWDWHSPWHGYIEESWSSLPIVYQTRGYGKSKLHSGEVALPVECDWVKIGLK